MDPEERIEALEREVKLLREHLAQLSTAYIHSSGADMAFQQATIALLASAPLDSALDFKLSVRLARVEAGIVHEGFAEGQLDGMQEALVTIQAAREEAHRPSAADASAGSAGAGA